MLIKATTIYKTYWNEESSVGREVLKGLDFEVDKGEMIAIMGPSGSGKTTLLNLLGTLDRPDSGKITLDGKALSALKTEEILNIRNKNIGFVFQFHHLLPQCSLLENVLLPSLPDKKNKKELREKAEELLKLIGIWEQRNNKPGELSGGECQRAAVARALINSPDLLLADEPTGQLDEKNAKLLMDLLSDINKKLNITIIIATHSLEIAERMDKIYMLREGKLEIKN